MQTKILAIALIAFMSSIAFAGPSTNAANHVIPVGQKQRARKNTHNKHAAETNQRASQGFAAHPYSDPTLKYFYDYNSSDQYGGFDPYYNWTADVGWFHDWYGDADKDWSNWFPHTTNKQIRQRHKGALPGAHFYKRYKMAGGTFGGTIERLSVITFDNGDKCLIAKIKNKDDDTAVLNLGIVKNLKDQNAKIKTGQHIKASGRSGRLNAKPILVVYSFSTTPKK
jgi:hypothetical protein